MDTAAGSVGPVTPDNAAAHVNKGREGSAAILMNAAAVGTCAAVVPGMIELNSAIGHGEGGAAYNTHTAALGHMVGIVISGGYIVLYIPAMHGELAGYRGWGRAYAAYFHAAAGLGSIALDYAAVHGKTGTAGHECAAAMCEPQPPPDNIILDHAVIVHDKAGPNARYHYA